MDTTPAQPTTKLAKRALNMGIYTWLGNAAGCLLGMIPLALPLSLVATLVTLLTGVGAMIWGVQGRREALQKGDDQGARDARIGFWLGAAHLIIVLLAGAALGAAMHFDVLGQDFLRD